MAANPAPSGPRTMLCKSLSKLGIPGTLTRCEISRGYHSKLFPFRIKGGNGVSRPGGNEGFRAYRLRCQKLGPRV